MTKVVLDAVGGDHAPKEAVAGVALAVERGYVAASEVVLTGPKAAVEAALREVGLDPVDFELHDAPDVLTCSDSPMDAVRKKPKNSIAVGVGLVKAGRAGAFISAGSTGTVVASATLGLRCLKGIRRPAIAAIIHGQKNPFLVLDVGANAQPKAHHLAQFAIMGSAYYQGTLEVDSPRVGILNIGSEEGKGNSLVQQARELIKALPIEFHGNIEGTEIFTGECHVVVTDGFSGNVLLKSSEGAAEYLLHNFKSAMLEAGIAPAAIQQVFRSVMPKVDFSEYGGALLLGVEGIVTICHGRSEAPAFANAIRFAKRALESNVNQHIVQAAEGMDPPAADANG